MNETTAVNWKAYQVIQVNCGEPDEVIGYFSNRNKAEFAALAAAANKVDTCNHQKIEIKEIIIQS